MSRLIGCVLIAFMISTITGCGIGTSTVSSKNEPENTEQHTEDGLKTTTDESDKPQEDLNTGDNVPTTPTDESDKLQEDLNTGDNVPSKNEIAELVLDNGYTISLDYQNVNNDSWYVDEEGFPVNYRTVDESKRFSIQSMPGDNREFLSSTVEEKWEGLYQTDYLESEEIYGGKSCTHIKIYSGQLDGKTQNYVKEHAYMDTYLFYIEEVDYTIIIDCSSNDGFDFNQLLNTVSFGR